MFNALALALTARQNNPEKRAMLPKMAFSGFKSRYREPKVEEGFEDITKVDFTVSTARCWRVACTADDRTAVRGLGGAGNTLEALLGFMSRD